jgi:hypothetical protein
MSGDTGSIVAAVLRRFTLMLAVPALVTGCSDASGKTATSDSVPPVTVPIAGRVDVLQSWTAADNEAGGRCSAKGVAADVKIGDRVVISDGSGAVVAHARLGTGSLIGDPTSNGLLCEFTFFAPRARLDASSYEVTVAQHAAQRFARDDMTMFPTITIG